MKATIARFVTGMITSAAMRDARRGVKAMRRVLLRGSAVVHYFHDAADPYSHLAAQLLTAFAARYRIKLVPHLVSPPDAAAAPDSGRLTAWSRRDAAMCAKARRLDMPDNAAAAPEAVAGLNAVLTSAIARGDFAAVAVVGGSALWRGQAAPWVARQPQASEADTAAAVAEGDALRAKLRHYLGATFYFEGEWYWGIDRLHYLEARLAGLGLDTKPGKPLVALVRDVTVNTQAPPDRPAGAAPGRVLHMFLSFRSPYTYIAMPRARALAAHYGAELRLRFVLPMVMRGLPVPGAKRIYITLDTKREAERLGLPFGTIVDPVGPGVERGLAVLHHAIAAGKGAEFAFSFLQGVFADGINSASKSGLNTIAARVGIDRQAVRAALADESWRAEAERNRADMLAAGLWGVPSFRVDDGPMVWGQDRLWMIEDMLAAPAP